MLNPRFVVSAFSIGLTVLGTGVTSGQDYPSKPLRIMAGSPGAGTDFTARLVAQGLTTGLGQQVIVENRNSIIAIETVAKARPDGYTLLLAGTSFMIEPLFHKTSYDPVRDFSPVTLAARSPNILIVHPSLPVKSVKELIALAKAKPGVLNDASIPIGNGSHIAAELFKFMAGVNILRIPYKGGAAALNALIGGEAPISFLSASAVAPQMKSGRLRALAITSAQPSALFPGLPTVAATLPGYEAISFYTIFVPSKTPATIINRLNEEIVRVLDSADVKEKFFSIGAEAVSSSPEEFAAAIKSDVAKMRKLIKDAGILPE